MANLSEFQDYVIAQLGETGEVHAKRMFGGVGVYVDEVFCAILTGEGRRDAGEGGKKKKRTKGQSRKS